MSLIFCSECGNKFSDKAKACPSCGCPIEEQEIDSVKEELLNKEDNQDIQDEKVDDISDVISSSQNQKSTKSKKIIIGLISILVIIVGLVSFLFIANRNSEKYLKSKIVGTWEINVDLGELVANVADRADMPLDMQNITQRLDMKMFLQFNKDNTLFIYTERGFTNNELEEFKSQLTLELGNKLYDTFRSKGYTEAQIKKVFKKEYKCSPREYCAILVDEMMNGVVESLDFSETVVGYYTIDKYKLYITDARLKKNTEDYANYSIKGKRLKLENLHGDFEDSLGMMVNDNKLLLTKSSKIIEGEEADNLVQKKKEEDLIANDRQVCDMIRSAIATCNLDPDICDINENLSKGDYEISDILSGKYGNTLGNMVSDIIDGDPYKKIMSNGANGKEIRVCIEGVYGNQVTVYIKGTNIGVGPRDDLY